MTSTSHGSGSMVYSSSSQCPMSISTFQASTNVDLNSSLFLAIFLTFFLYFLLSIITISDAVSATRLVNS